MCAVSNVIAKSIIIYLRQVFSSLWILWWKTRRTELHASLWLL